jgi:signal transduction histidine kinase
MQTDAPVYLKVRNWYLAGLRTRAYADQQATATPGTLILEDQNLLKDMVRKASGKLPATISVKLEYARSVRASFLIWAALIVAYILVLAVAFNFNYNAMGSCLFLGLAARIENGSLSVQVTPINGILSLMGFAVIIAGLPYILSFIRPEIVVTGTGRLQVTPVKSVIETINSRLVTPLAAATFLLLALVTQNSLITLATKGIPVDPTLHVLPFAFVCCILYIIFLQLVVTNDRFDFLSHLFIALAAAEITVDVRSLGDSQSKWRYISQALANIITELSTRERLIADYSTDVLLGLTKDLKVTAVSPNVLTSWGYEPHSLLDTTISIFVDDRNASEFQAGASTAFNTKRPTQVLSRIIARSGKPIDIRWTLEWSDTESLLFVSARDVSPQQQLERARKEFLSMVTHDLRTPANAVLTSIQLAKRSAENEKAVNHLEKADRLIKRMINLTDEIIDADKAAAGKLELQLANVDTNMLLDKSLEEISTLANSRHLQLTSNVESFLLLCDPHRIQRVLVNLLSNACKFSPEGSMITITCKKQDSFAYISIADSGPGSPDSAKLFVFEPYEQIGATNYSTLTGSGLGLSICKSLVESHGGRIGINNARNGGAEFWLLLPCGQQSDQCSPASN